MTLDTKPSIVIEVHAKEKHFSVWDYLEAVRTVCENIYQMCKLAVGSHHFYDFFFVLNQAKFSEPQCVLIYIQYISQEIHVLLKCINKELFIVLINFSSAQANKNTKSTIRM